MGLTKQYLAYRPVDSFNIITSARTNVNFVVYNGIEGRYVLTGAAENAIVWDLRLGERVATFRRDKIEVTALRSSPDNTHISIGYADGVVEVFDLNSPLQAICSLAVHKSAVSIIRYDNEGMRLVSGGLDTELVVVDIVEQAGKQRLTGHNASITDGHFLQVFGQQNIVISSSKDTQIKFWNLDTQFCFKTIVDNRTEVWALAFVGTLMVAGCGESSMNVYRLKQHDVESQPLERAVEGLSIDDEDTISPISVSNCGVIQRAGKGRTVSLVTDMSERVISCHGTNDLIESFYICTDDEAKKRLAKRLKKANKSADNIQSQEVSLSDEIKRLESIKVKQKIKSIDVILGSNNELRVAVSLANNSLQLYSLNVLLNQKKNIKENYKLLRSLTRAGHQSEIRTVCFSSDSLAIGSGAAESFKFWNRETMQCLRTVTSDYILCATFVPGDRYALLGMKTGKLLIVDVGTAKNGNNTKQIEDFEVTPNPLVTTAFTSNRDFSIFEISFFWYKVLGGLIVWVVAIPLSYFWKRDKYEKINPKLFTPIVRKFIKFDTIEMEEMPLKSPILNGENNATIIMSNAKNGGIDKAQHQKQNGANGDV
ncbi:WD repeat-containing protein 3-like [Teleopsis dalmanni]|uniref:WD repeat-containing protein 3-like n=1 Tax=Teleopsis dalmanni TaxID=139649 RepID=UPI0018CC97B0|nr:WD repeat-containing protein 3-like [Teleopsis dalmanni]